MTAERTASYSMVFSNAAFGNTAFGNAKFCNGAFASGVNPISVKIGRKAWQALLEEVYTTPKPGLVDLYSCGAHKDMNVGTFERSAGALLPYFIRMAAQGLCSRGTPQELFREIRRTGLAAEQAMYRATGGVNTHKGLIFTLGIFCAAAGRCIQENGRITAVELSGMQKQMTIQILLKELQEIHRKEAASHGEENLQKYGTAGIRGEAVAGYPGIWKAALPVLEDGIRNGQEWNRVKLQTLMVLMSRTEDSNILSRHDPIVLAQVQQETEQFLKKGGAYAPDALEELRRMDADYIRRNISAGGCADLLAAAIFLELLLR